MPEGTSHSCFWYRLSKLNINHNLLGAACDPGLDGLTLGSSFSSQSVRHKSNFWANIKTKQKPSKYKNNSKILIGKPQRGWMYLSALVTD